MMSYLSTDLSLCLLGGCPSLSPIVTSMSSEPEASILDGGETDLDLGDRLLFEPAAKSLMLDKWLCKDKFCGISSLLRGSEGSGGKGGNRPEGGGNPVPLADKGNLGKPAGMGEGGPPAPPGAPPSVVPRSWAAAAETGGVKPGTMPGRFGNLNPGGKMGVIPAMGLLTNGAMGKPFFSASSINCSMGG